MPAASDSRSVIYLAFHQIQSRLTPGITSVSPVQLERILELLPLKNQSNQSEHSNIPFDLGISFDDGYSELAELLPPFVEHLKIPPVIFTPTDWIGKENRWDYLHRFGSSRHLNHAEIQRLSQSGVLFGSHGASHKSLTRLSAGHRREELIRSKRTLEDLTGTRVTMLAYPYGQASDAVVEDARSVGYLSGFTMNLPSGADGVFNQGRVPVYRCDSFSILKAKIPGHPLHPFFRAGNSIIRLGGWLSSRLSR